MTSVSAGNGVREPFPNLDALSTLGDDPHRRIRDHSFCVAGRLVRPIQSTQPLARLTSGQKATREDGPTSVGTRSGTLSSLGRNPNGCHDPGPTSLNPLVLFLSGGGNTLSIQNKGSMLTMGTSSNDRSDNAASDNAVLGRATGNVQSSQNTALARPGPERRQRHWTQEIHP